MEKLELESNGMPAFSYSIPATKAFVCLLAFPGGSVFEEKRGLAHLAEHLPFRGNSSYPHNLEIAKAAEEMGAHINAATTHESVVFYIQGHAERSNEMLELLGLCLKDPLFRDEDIIKEKEVVAEEIKSYQQSPSFFLTKKVTEALYGNHPLAQPVIGDLDSVASITKGDIMSFRNQFWEPSLGGLFLAGDTSFLAPGSIEAAFASLPSSGSQLHYQPLPEQKEKIFLLEEDEEQTDARLVWRLSNKALQRRERTALAVYSNILGGTMSSQLFQEMREKRSLCYHAAASGIASSYGAGLILSFSLSPDKLEEALTLARDIVVGKNITEEEVVRARNLLASDWALSLESSFRVASNASSLYLTYGEESQPEDIIAEIQSIDLDYLLSCLEMIEGDPAIVLRGPHGENSFPF